MITRITYDGSWPGLLSVIFEVYDRKLKEVNIQPAYLYQPDAFSELLAVNTDENRAQRVWLGLEKRLTRWALSSLFYCYLSELPGIENTIVAYVRLALSNVKSIESAYGYTEVLEVSKTTKMVGREKHRMEAFVRFQLTKDGIFFSGISPDYNVIPLITTHFKNRYTDQKWIIYDLKRHYGMFYDLDKIEEIYIDKLPQIYAPASTNMFSTEEKDYQSLWKTYFTSVNIKERKNTKLHRQFVPKRYWKYLTEKLPD